MHGELMLKASSIVRNRQTSKRGSQEATEDDRNALSDIELRLLIDLNKTKETGHEETQTKYILPIFQCSLVHYSDLMCIVHPLYRAYPKREILAQSLRTKVGEGDRGKIEPPPRLRGKLLLSEQLSRSCERR